ncbi:MAG: FKBP-type peptidyl-prolyl cis-trans isomerase [Thermofilaceae archaeon]
MSENVKPVKGDAVLLEYTIIDKATARVLETTTEQVAKDAGLYSEETKYGPRLVILGSGELPSGLEEQLVDVGEGEEREIELPPEKAFGRRDPEKIRVIPAREFSARGIIPRAGMEVEVRGERGTVISVGSGRVIVDFNHPLAGRELVFKVKVVKVLKSAKEKTEALFKKYVTIDGASLNFENGTAVITIPFNALFSPENLEALNAFARSVESYVSDIKAVKLVSTILERNTEEAGAGTR